MKKGKKKWTKFNQFDERITNMERKILDMDEKYEHRSEDAIGMDFGRARIECTAKPITHAFIHFMTLETETSSSGQRTC